MHTIKYLNSFKDKSLRSVRASLYAISIKTGYDNENRVILFPESRGENVIGAINNESNGLIISLEDEKIKCLTVPMPMLRNSNQINRKSILNGWNDSVKVYSCKEGTNFTLYYFKDHWCISTAKGIEVNDLYWNGDLTYEQMLDECFGSQIDEKEENEKKDEKKVQSNFESFCEKLNKNYSYAMGFCHPVFHMFATDKPSFWTYKVTNLTDLSDVTDNCPEMLNVEQPLKLPEDLNVEKYYDELQKTCANATDKFLSDGTVNLGYMMRGINDGDISIQSELQVLINKLYYDSSFTKEIAQTSYDRHLYVLLQNYMFEKELFLKIFPKFRLDFERFDKKIDGLLSDIENMYRKSKKTNKSEIQSNNPVHFIKKNIDRMIKVNPDDKNFHITIKSVLFHLDNFEFIYQVLFA